MLSPFITAATTTTIASPALSVASWSQINDVYQINITAANQVIEDFLNSPHNTWNYPSPNSDVPTPLTVPVFPDPSVSLPAFLAPLIVDSPPVVPITSTSPVFVATLPNFLQVLADVAAQQDYLPSPQLKYPNPEPQDAYIHQCFEEVVEHVPLADIPVKNLPLPVVTTPVAIVPSPAPPTPPHCILPLPILLEAKLFPHLFAAPPCTTANHHPHQYTVVYECREKIWTPQDEYIECNFLVNIPKHDALDQYHPYFVIPFCALCYHFIQVTTNSPLPNVFMCAKLGWHPLSLHFPFGYIESSFIDSIKFLFEQFPPAWLEYFEGALIPLTSYNLLDSQLITLVGQLHFMPGGIFVIDRNTRTEDLLRTQPHLAQFTCTPCLPTHPFLHITPPPVEVPL